MPTTQLTDASQWTSVTLSDDELWQARGGTILTTIETPLAADQGIALLPGNVRFFKSGVTVRYRPIIPAGVTTTILLAREAE